MPSCPSTAAFRLASVAIMTAPSQGLLTMFVGSSSPEALRDARSCRRRIHGRRQLVPNLDLVPVRIGGEDVRLTRTEFALALDDSAGALDRARGPIDVRRPQEAEPEVRDAAGLAGFRPLRLLEHDDVTGPGRLDLNEVVVPVHFHGAEDLSVESRSAIEIAHGKRNVSQPVRADHRQFTNLLLQ